MTSLRDQVCAVLGFCNIIMSTGSRAPGAGAAGPQPSALGPPPARAFAGPLNKHLAFYCNVQFLLLLF